MSSKLVSYLNTNPGPALVNFVAPAMLVLRLLVVKAHSVHLFS